MSVCFSDTFADSIERSFSFTTELFCSTSAWHCEAGQGAWRASTTLQHQLSNYYISFFTCSLDYQRSSHKSSVNICLAIPASIITHHTIMGEIMVPRGTIIERDKQGTIFGEIRGSESVRIASCIYLSTYYREGDIRKRSRSDRRRFFCGSIANLSVHKSLDSGDTNENFENLPLVLYVVNINLLRTIR